MAAIAGVALAVAALVTTLVIYRLQRKRKNLIYDVVSDSPLAVLLTERHRATVVSLAGTSTASALNTPLSTTVRLANSGNVPIQQSDLWRHLSAARTAMLNPSM